jgi:hypothetical protein
MSIERIPPFEQSKNDKSEKGFRDALIMFTILTNIKGRKEDYSLVVTGDRLLTEGLNSHTDEFKTALTIVPNLDEAIAHIDARVGAEYRELLRKESEGAKAELAKYKKEISKQVNAIQELTEYDLGIGGFYGVLSGKPLELGESLELVKSLNIDEIDSAVWRDKDKPESRILFRLLFSANVITSVSSSLPILSPKKYAVGERQQPPSFLTLAAFPPRQEQERTFPVTLYGEAKFEKTNGGWKLTGIRVDKAISAEEMAALSRVPQQAN